MSPQNGSPDTPAPPKSRLNGWKEIAAHIGRGIRTAQRWERDLGMPVHRMNTGAGEAVYALRDEVDAWMARQSRSSLAPVAQDGDPDSGPNADDGGNGQRPTAPATATGRWRRWAVPVGLAVLAAIAGTGYLLRSAPSAPPGPLEPSDPATLEFVGHTMNARDKGGRVLWSKTFAAIQDFASDPVSQRRATAVGDLDGDGRADVVVANMDPADGNVHAWDHAGRTRFVHRFDRPVRFGDYRCPPTLATGVLVDPDPRFRGAIWVWGHHPMFFPAVLQRLDAAGRPQGEYWSNGYIYAVRSFVLAGRAVTLVGGANNDLNGGSLAAFYGDVNGSAPSLQPKYTCTGCPPGAPDTFLVFPRSRFNAARGNQAVVTDFTPVGQDAILVRVEILGHDGATVEAFYTLDKDLHVSLAELAPGAAAIHERLEARGVASPATRFRGNADLFPVHRWNGRGWDVITRAEPSREQGSS